MAIKYNPNYSDTNESVYLSGTVTVNTTGVEAKVEATAAEGRQFVSIYNKGNSTIYFGPSELSTSDMEPLLKKQRVEIAASSGIIVILKTDSGTSDVVIQEIG